MAASDKQFFELFRSEPDLLKDILNLAPDGLFTFDAIVEKKFQMEIDGYFQSRKTGSPDYVVEFQGYKRKEYDIYHRIVRSMSHVSLSREMGLKQVHGVVIFTDAALDTLSRPWHYMTTDNDPLLVVLFLKDALDDLEKRKPDHPLVSTFAPFLAKNKKELKVNAPAFYRRILKADVTPKVKKTMARVFESFMFEAFKNLTMKEVHNMIGILTPLAETRAYREVVAIGREEELARQAKKLDKMLAEGMLSREAYEQLYPKDLLQQQDRKGC